MYRPGYIYDEIDERIIDIFIDYDIKDFPVDAEEVCKRMGVKLKPYSQYGGESIVLMNKMSKDGFFVKESKTTPPTIYYNDLQPSKGSIRFTIFHELKHYVFEDENDDEDDLAEHFARYFMCPTPYLLLKDTETVDEIVSFYGTSGNAAENARKAALNRKKKHNKHLFEYEKRLIKHLEPNLL